MQFSWKIFNYVEINVCLLSISVYYYIFLDYSTVLLTNNWIQYWVTVNLNLNELINPYVVLKKEKKIFNYNEIPTYLLLNESICDQFN